MKTTTYRLEKAVTDHYNKVTNSIVAQNVNNLQNDLSITEAEGVKFYVDLGVVDCKLVNGEIVKAKINYPFSSNSMKFDALPDGKLIEGKYRYIEPYRPVHVNLLYCINDKSKFYYVIGYSDNNYDNYSSTCKTGSMELSAGLDSKIEVNKNYINLKSPNILLNGIKVGKDMNLYVDKMIVGNQDEEETSLGQSISKDEVEPYQIELPPEYQTPEYKKLRKAIGQLNSLIGLNKTKRQVAKLIHLLMFNEKYKSSGRTPLPVSKNVVFTGNPGTGKTTVAGILGQIYKELGILSKGHFNKYDNSSLIGEYTGQTAPKVKKAFQKSAGGVLFIDEAYNLIHRADDSFGKEALATIVGEMHDDGQDDIAVILAGYRKPIINMMSYNEGMLDRFNTYIDFPDYNPEHLREIFEFSCKKYGFKVGAEAEEVLVNHLNNIYYNRTKGYANARTVNKLFNLSASALAARYFVRGIDPKRHRPVFEPEDITQGIISAKTEVRLESNEDDKSVNYKN